MLSEGWFVIRPLLTNVSALPGETWTPEIVSFRSCWPTTQQAFRSDVALLHIAWCTVAIILQVDWRRYSEHFLSEKKTKSTACSESSVVIETRYRAWLKRHNFGVRVSPGSAETLVTRCGIKKWPFDSILSLRHLFEKLTEISWCAVKL